MKKIFPVGSSLRKKLIEGFIVLQLEGVERPNGDHAAQAVFGQGDVVWLHIGLMYLRPYRPTFQLMHDLPDHVENAGGERIVLQGQGVFLIELAAF